MIYRDCSSFEEVNDADSSVMLVSLEQFIFYLLILFKNYNHRTSLLDLGSVQELVKSSFYL